MSILSKMSVFAAYNFDWKTPVFEMEEGNEQLTTSKALVMPYTDEEESWLLKQFQLLDDAHKSVKWGEETIKEFMMYSLEVPVSKHFMKSKLRSYLRTGWKSKGRVKEVMGHFPWVLLHFY